MLVREVVIPTRDNDGASLTAQRHAIESQLLTLTGGYSKSKQSGAWRDTDGRVYKDTSYRYSIACDAGQDAAIVAALPQWCGMLRQECLYTSVHQESVSFVSAASVAA